jgi:PleD family two-component response regulator
VPVTVSVGVAGSTAWPTDPDALLARADAACYRAKEGGRNRVESEIPAA